MESVLEKRADTDFDRIEEIARYNIKRYLRLSGRSQNSLAEPLGLTTGSVSQMLGGYSHLKLGYVVLAARELGVTIDNLLDDQYLKQDEKFIEKWEIQLSKTTKVPPVGLEPTTHDLKGRCSNH